MSSHVLSVHSIAVSKVPNAKAGRDQIDINIYGMEGVPAQAIEERLNFKLTLKKNKVEKELKAMGINIDAPSFNINDYKVDDPRPSKR